MQKYNIDLKLQVYIHINNSLHEDSEKIGPEIIKDNVRTIDTILCWQLS